MNVVDAAVRVALDLVFPDANYQPTLTAQFPKVAAVPTPVAFDFLLPVGAERASPTWESPTVPVIAIDEHDHFRRDEHQVGLTREPTRVFAEPQPACMEQAPDGQLGARVLAPDQRHGPAALGGREVVHASVRRCLSLP